MWKVETTLGVDPVVSPATRDQPRRVLPTSPRKDRSEGEGFELLCWLPERKKGTLAAGEVSGLLGWLKWGLSGVPACAKKLKYRSSPMKKFWSMHTKAELLTRMSFSSTAPIRN